MKTLILVISSLAPLVFWCAFLVVKNRNHKKRLRRSSGAVVMLIDSRHYTILSLILLLAVIICCASFANVASLLLEEYRIATVTSRLLFGTGLVLSVCALFVTFADAQKLFNEKVHAGGTFGTDVKVRKKRILFIAKSTCANLFWIIILWVVPIAAYFFTS